MIGTLLHSAALNRGVRVIWCGAALVSCADLEGSDKEAASEAFSARMDVAFPDGSSTQIDLTHGSLNGAMEFDPDDRPEMRRMVLRFQTAPDEGVDCRLDLSVDGYCGPGSYPLGASATATATLFDCPGVPDDYESVVNLTAGAVELSRLSVEAERGATAGSAYPVQVEGSVVHTLDGLSIAASFQIDALLDGRDAEEQDCAEFTPLDDGSGTGGSDSGGSDSGGSGSGGSGSGGSGSGGSGSGEFPDGETPVAIEGEASCLSGSDSSGMIFVFEVDYADPQGDYDVEYGDITARIAASGDEIFSESLMVCREGRCDGSFRDGVYPPLTCATADEYAFSATVTDRDGHQSESIELTWRD